MSKMISKAFTTFLVFYVIISFSCNSQNASNSTQGGIVYLDSIYYNIEELTIFKLSRFNQSNNRNYIIDTKGNFFEINFDNQETRLVFNLNSILNKKTVENIQDFYPSDKYLELYTPKELIRIDRQTRKVIFKKNFSKMLGSSYGLYCNFKHHVEYLNEETLLIPLFDQRIRNNEHNYSQSVTMAVYNLTNGQYQLIRTGFPYIHKEKNMGLILGMTSALSKPDVYISHLTTDTITRYNLETGAISRKSVKSRYDTSAWFGLSDNFTQLEMWEHFRFCKRYGKLFTDENSPYVYRLFGPSLPAQFPDGRYTSDSDKDLVIMVMDKDLNVLDEILINGYFMNSIGTIFRDGNVCLPVITKDNETKDRGKFYVFKWSPSK